MIPLLLQSWRLPALGALEVAELCWAVVVLAARRPGKAKPAFGRRVMGAGVASWGRRPSCGPGTFGATQWWVVPQLGAPIKGSSAGSPPPPSPPSCPSTAITQAWVALGGSQVPHLQCLCMMGSKTDDIWGLKAKATAKSPCGLLHDLGALERKNGVHK